MSVRVSTQKFWVSVYTSIKFENHTKWTSKSKEHFWLSAWVKHGQLNNQRNNMKYKILKNIECLLFCLYLGFFKSTYSSPDDIPSILDEFNIYHPIIINTMTDTKDLMRIVKSMSFNGQSINFNKNKINRLYQSYLIFTNLKNFKWHEPTSAPILVVNNKKWNWLKAH